MFFSLSKIIWFVLAPSNFLALLIALGLLLASLTKRRATAMTLAGTGCLGLFLLGLSPLANLALYPLEARFPLAEPLDQPMAGPVHGIIILGGAQDADASTRLGQPILNEAGERLVVGLDLARRHPKSQVLLSGGSGALFKAEDSEARASAALLTGLGLAPERLLIEDRSRNTHENAVFSREVADPRPGDIWLLVTSAFHMPRAMGAFRQAGFAVVPYPVDFRVVEYKGPLGGFATISDGLRRFDVAAREYIGLAAYRLTGRTDALFPGP